MRLSSLRLDTMQIHICLKTQSLSVIQGTHCLARFSIASAKLGAGEQKNSHQTPRGWHKIGAKIGENCPINTVFVGRRPTGEIYHPDLAERYPDRDWILTRILWLKGCEPGKNRFGMLDTMQRYIYIHGTPDTVPMGIPSSHGCIRMRNTDIIRLYDMIPLKTPVLID